MKSYSSGLFIYGTLESQPSSVSTFLHSHQTPTSKELEKIFADFAPETLVLSGVALDSVAVSTLQVEVAKCISLTSISCAGGVQGLHPRQLFSALVENTSIAKVDFSGCGLTLADAREIAESVVPWSSRTLVDWNLADNSELGDEGVLTIVGAMAQGLSSVQRLSLKHTGLTEAGIERVLEQLSQLTCLYQFDIAQRAPVTEFLKKKLDDLDAALQQNLQLLHTPTSSSHISVASGFPEPRHPTPPPSMPEEEEIAFVEVPVDKAPSPQKKAVKRPVDPKTLQPKRLSPENPRNFLSQKKENSPDMSSPAAEKPLEGNPGLVDTAITTAKKLLLPQEVKRRPSPAPNRPLASRSSSASRPRSVRDSPARSRTPLQRDVRDGVDVWKKVKDEYNKFIRDPSAVPVPIKVSKPKFLFGKSLDKITQQKSPAFAGGFSRVAERAPTPAEIRKMAPWKEGHSIPGQEHIVQKRDKHGNVTNIRFVDGGDISMLNDDPRDIGYVARKVKEGHVRLGQSSAFRSNTAREMRWGIDERTCISRTAQAPGPGSYTIQSEWEKNATRFREQSRLRKPTLGGTGPRSSNTRSNGVPGPGFYEIP